ncbi:monocarboxylate transporter 12-like isoform X2 [Amphiura filiformis]|uniref:monocarboxylate transporter 12-like isoform X2 n=1 Tax=Amphiura filiformis TaxID=82378 RepID=UPI003B2122E4
MAKNSSKFRGFGVILSGFITRVLIVGLYSSLGLFFIEWNEYFSASATKISLVGSVFIGILWSSSLLGSSLSHRLSFRTITIVGGLIAACSFTITSLLVDSLDYIIATFVVAGVGLGIAYLSAQAVLLFNFDKHLGKATSLANCGSGVGMFIIPLSFRYLLDEFGWRGCLFIAAGIYTNICVCGALLRPSPSEKHMRKHQKVMVTIDAENTSFVGLTSDPNDSIFTTIMKSLQGIANSLDISLFYTNARFVAYFVVGFLCGMSFPPIFIYLAPKAVQDGLTKTEASYLLSFVGLGGTTGRFASGVFVDYSPFTLSSIYALSYLISGILALLLPLGNTFAVLATISVSFGFSTGVCHCLYIFVAKEFVGLDKSPGAVSWFNANYAFGSSDTW